jgi:hypothetical protein
MEGFIAVRTVVIVRGRKPGCQRRSPSPIHSRIKNTRGGNNVQSSERTP